MPQTVYLFCLAFLLTCIILPLEGWIVSRLVGCFEIEDKMQALQNCLIIMQTIVAYYLLRALINGFFASYIKEAFSHTFISYLIADIFASVHAHSVRYFDDEMSGRISAAVNGFARGLVSAFTNTCYMLIRPALHADCIVCHYRRVQSGIKPFPAGAKHPVLLCRL